MPTYFRHERNGDVRVGAWLADGKAYDVCENHDGPHDADACMITALLGRSSRPPRSSRAGSCR